jgi:hypothetical protein
MRRPNAMNTTAPRTGDAGITSNFNLSNQDGADLRPQSCGRLLPAFGEDSNVT